MTRDELLALVADRYQTTPEHLWERWPGYVVLRNASNQKWYGVVMDVPAGRLGLEDAAPDERVDILNVKVDPDDALVLRLSQDILPAYHMSRRNWVSVRLARVPSELVGELIETSRRLTA